MPNDCASLIAAARSAAADSLGAEPAALEREDASAVLGPSAISVRLVAAERSAALELLRCLRRIRLRLRHNVGVDRRAAALRHGAYAHQHASRRNAAACPRRTTC